MNRKTFAALAGLLLGSLGWGESPAHAQVPPSQLPPPKTNVTPARTITRDRTEVMAQWLKLSDEQKQKAKPIFDEETKKMAAFRTNRDIKPEERQAKALAIRGEIGAKLKPILNEEQWAKFSRVYLAQPGTPGRADTNAPAKPAK